MTPLDLLLGILSHYPGYSLQSIPARGEKGGWIPGVVVLVGVFALAAIQALGKPA
jgi:hypothetical protein